MSQQLALFTFSSATPAQSVVVPVPLQTAATCVPAGWRLISETALEVGLTIPVYAESSWLDALNDPEDALLWEALWMARFHLETLQQDKACFTISLDGREQRFFAQYLQPAGILLRLDQPWDRMVSVRINSHK